MAGFPVIRLAMRCCRAGKRERLVAERLLPGLERRLRAEVGGGVHFDRFSRGRYATDASHYQIMPLGVAIPRTMAEAERLRNAAESRKAPIQ